MYKGNVPPVTSCLLEELLIRHFFQANGFASYLIFIILNKHSKSLCPCLPTRECYIDRDGAPSLHPHSTTYSFRVQEITRKLIEVKI